MSQMTERWHDALAARAAISPRSPVAVLDALLQGTARNSKPGEDLKIFSRNSPREGVVDLRSRPRKGA